jgi:hypothetical protein
MLRSLAAAIVALTVGGLTGYVLGERQGFIRGMRDLEGEVVGALSFYVETASCVRTGDVKRALELLDMRVDGAVLRLTAARRNVGFLAAQAGQVRPEQALGQAKLYRSVVPSLGRDAAAVSSALDGVLPSNGAPPALAALTKRVGG